MMWATQDVDLNDHTISNPESTTDDSSNEIDLQSFQEQAFDKYELPEEAATLIFTRKNTQENGEYEKGTLDEPQLEEADENLAALDTIVDELEITSMDKDAALILIGDIDGKMTTENVEKLIDQGILKVDDGHLRLTEKNGQNFFNYLMKGDQSDLIGSKHITQHLDDFNALSKPEVEAEEVNEAKEEITFSDKPVMDESGRFQTRDVIARPYNTQTPETVAYNTKDPEKVGFNTQEIRNGDFNTKDVEKKEFNTKDTEKSGFNTKDVEVGSYNTKEVKPGTFNTKEV